jgi:hypothetical protein
VMVHCFFIVNWMVKRLFMFKLMVNFVDGQFGGQMSLCEKN